MNSVLSVLTVIMKKPHPYFFSPWCYKVLENAMRKSHGSGHLQLKEQFFKDSKFDLL